MIPFLMHHHLERWADASPDRPAVESTGGVLSYGALEARANRIAAALSGLGVRPRDPVGVWLARSVDMLAAYHAVLKIGAVCVPLDDRAPPARVATIVADYGIRVLVARPDRGDAAKDLCETAELTGMVLLGDEPPVIAGLAVTAEAEIAACPGTRPAWSGTELDTALILTTSGSTGTPKGVALSHRAAGLMSDFASGWFRFGPEDRVAHLAPPQHVLSLAEIFSTFSVGATLVIVPAEVMVLPAELPRFLAEQGITFFCGVASMLTMMLERGNLRGTDLPSLRGLLFGGEPMSAKHARQLTKALPGVSLVQGYGTTEAGVCLIYPVPDSLPDDIDRLPTGTAAPNMEVYLVTDAGVPAAPGQAGEIHARGRGLMTGYWGLAEETTDVLVDHPFDPECTDPVYRTGDIGVLGEDGVITITGRRDQQVKTRGVRVELAEVEAAILAHPAVAECAVVPVTDEVFTNLLVAHVTVNGELSAKQLREWSRRRLAPAMVPARFEIHEALPKTSTGKVDRAGLRAASSSSAP